MFNGIPNAQKLANNAKISTRKPTTDQNGPYVREYNQKMVQCIKKAISYMEENEKEKSYVIVDMHGDVTVGDKSRKFHTMHYGFIGDEWSTRISYVTDSDMPFRGLQRALKEKGYYLLDESDPSLSKKTRIMIYAGRPDDYDTRTPLWHKMNVLPR